MQVAPDRWYILIMGENMTTKKTTNAIKFRTLDYASFDVKYGAEDPFTEGVVSTLPAKFGEVNIPGTGWRGCVIGNKKVPTHFWDDDDGWVNVPNVEFVRS